LDRLAVPQLFCGFHGEVGQNAIGTGSLKAQQALQHHTLVVEPAVGRGRAQHGVLAADLINVGGDGKSLLHPAHDVQVRHARLDHHHVRAFGQIERYFADGFVAVGRVHLVGPLVARAQAGRRTDCIAERAVEGRSVFGGVGHDPHALKAGGVQRLAYRADPAIHHVGRCDHVAARLGLHHRLTA